MSIILDYSESIVDWRGKRPMRELMPADPTLFYSRIGWCPVCDLEAQKLVDLEEGTEGVATESLKVWSCQNCGWWDYQTYECEVEGGQPAYDDPIEWYDLTIRRIGLLRSFNASSAQLPLEVLQQELHRRPERIHEVHPRKMEELVASVFADFWPCEVKHCGRSHDGGVDLYTVNGDRPVSIQVKRRARPDSVETVRLVREFLGATLLGGYRHAVLVSTAHHFSREAREASLAAVSTGLVDRFELMDRDRFFKIFRLVNPNRDEPWRRHVPKEWQSRIGGAA